jgi:hypothetical protein
MDSDKLVEIESPPPFILNGVTHDRGKDDCGACDGGGVLGPCQYCKDGKVHSQYVGYDRFGGIVIEKCDECG